MLGYCCAAGVASNDNKEAIVTSERANDWAKHHLLYITEVGPSAPARFPTP